MTDIIFFEPAPPAKRSETDIATLMSQFKSGGGTSVWTIPQAFLALLLSAAIADGSYQPEEREEMTALAHRTRTLKQFNANQLSDLNKQVQKLLNDRPDSLREACETLPTDVRLSVFAHCVDIILADGILQEPEARYLSKIGSLMRLDQPTADKILEVILIKNRF